jgi:hypothetical protein
MFLELEFVKFLKYLKLIKKDDFETTFKDICTYLENVSDTDLKALLVFFTDDFFINNTPLAENWTKNLLETKFYGTMIGGNKFIKNYEKFKDSQFQLRDLYILSTKLGYKVNLEKRKYDIPLLNLQESYQEQAIDTQYFSFLGILIIVFLVCILMDIVEIRRIISIVVKDIINWKK